MGSIAICVCPNDSNGDPFINCMQLGDTGNETGLLFYITLCPNFREMLLGLLEFTTIIKWLYRILIIIDSGMKNNQNQFVASFDVGSVHHQSRSNAPASVKPTTTSKPATASTTITTTKRSPMLITSTTTTTRSPFIHDHETSTSRPATISHGHGNYPDDNSPESHRIPIINNNHYPHHNYLPKPMDGSFGSSTSSPSYNYQGSSTNRYPDGSYNLFHEKTMTGAIGDYGTTPYTYRGTATHLSGSHNAYEYDSRPITPPTSSYHHHRPYQHQSNYNNNGNMNRFGSHGHHPASSGFPDPITESSTSYNRYASSSSYADYNYNPSRNDLRYHNSGGYERVADPLGKYDNCRSVNGIILCADNSHNSRPNFHSHNPPPLYDESEMRNIGGGTTNRYGFQTSRGREEYSTYYPIRHSPSPSSYRPITNDYHSYDINRQGYPYSYHDSSTTSSSNYPHSFLPKEQRISAQSTLTITSPSGSIPSAGRNENEHPLCKTMCGIGSICRLVLERPVCGCPEGHTGDPSLKCSPVHSYNNGGKDGGQIELMGQCQRHIDCKQNEICAKNKCIDPCKEQGFISSSSVNFIGVGGGADGGHDICGSNAECLVVGHTPVCKCRQFYSGNPYVACVP